MAGEFRSNRPWEVGSRPSSRKNRPHRYAVKASFVSEKSLAVASKFLSCPPASAYAAESSPNHSQDLSPTTTLVPTKRSLQEDSITVGHFHDKRPWHRPIETLPSNDTGAVDNGSSYCTETNVKMLCSVASEIGEAVTEHETLVHGERSGENQATLDVNVIKAVIAYLSRSRDRLRRSNESLKTLLTPESRPSIQLDLISTGAITALSGSAQLKATHDAQRQSHENTQAHAKLTKEYELLLQKYHKLKAELCALARKVESVDAENMALLTDKERLQEHVGCLEAREQELQRDCIEARQTNEQNKKQYIQMLAMAGKLQESEAPVPVSNDARDPGVERSIVAQSQTDVGVSIFQIRQLSTEISKLKARNERLQTTLMDVKLAALSIAVDGQNLSHVIKKAVDDS